MEETPWRKQERPRPAHRWTGGASLPPHPAAEQTKEPARMSDFISWIKSLFGEAGVVIEARSWQVIQYMKALEAKELEQSQEKLD